MVRTQIYIEDHEHREINRIAKQQGRSMAHIMREVLKQWIEEHNQARKNGAAGLLKIAKLAEKEGWSGPADLSQRHNDYFIEAWEESHK